MAEDGGQRMLVGAVDEMQVGMADAGGGGADQHLTRPGQADMDILDAQRLAYGTQDGGLHRRSPVSGLANFMF
jgi:hypothetical protein